MSGLFVWLGGVPLMPLFWLIAAVALTLLEVFTYQLVAVWFAIGAVAGLIASVFRMDVTIQFVVFTVVSLLCLMMTRPIVKKVFRVEKVKTNSDRIIGAQGVVIRTITPEEKGRIMVDGLDWSAASIQGTAIAEGEKVIVRQITGVTAMVEPLAQISVNENKTVPQ